jgi:four helix bundle protein
MPTITSFKDIKAWQKAHWVSVEIYKLTNSTELAKDFGLRDQMRRSSVSVSSNIAEGYERGGKKEFIRYLIIAKASNTELRSQLLLSKDLNYISVEQYENLDESLIEVNKMISGFIAYLNKVK